MTEGTEQVGLPDGRECANETISDSVVLLETEVWRLDTQARGKKELGPFNTSYPSEVDLASDFSPAKSALSWVVVDGAYQAMVL